MKKFLVYLLVIVCVVSMGFAIFYLVRDNEVISVTHASMYVDKGQNFDIELKHKNKKKSTEINITTSSDSIVKVVSGKAGVSYMAVGGGVARINFRTSNVRYRNLWCDVIVGDGSEENPFYISSAEQLSQIGQSEEYGLDKSYKLVNDIDMSEVNNGFVKPAGDFTGVFDGNGYTISNIVIDQENYSDAAGDTQNAVNASASVSSAFENAGFFSRIMPGARVYNVNFDNVYINGTYKTAGVVAGVNYGTVERIAVTNAIFNLTGNADNFYGGIVGLNETTETNEEGNITRNIARIDRCSVNAVWGKGYNIDSELVNVGITGTIGGLTGKNIGGIVIYSYTEGQAVFGNSNVIYGGLVGVNNYTQLTPTLFDDNNKALDEFVGGNIKDSYAYIETFMKNGNLSANVYGGVIGKVYDYYVTKVVNETSSKVTTNLIVGLYYENELLNAEQDNISSKALTGVGKYYADTTGSTNNEFTSFKDSEFVVMAKENGDIEFTDSYNEQFKSHEKVEHIFDENGEYKDTERSTVYWPFNNVWYRIEESEDKNFPILNYGIADYSDGFDDLGNSVIVETANGNEIRYIQSNYVPQINVDTYDVTLIMVTHPTTQLRATPSNLKYTWASSDESVVTVDATGKVTAQNIGSAIITATLQTDEEKGIVGGTTASCVVTVIAPDFELTPSTKTIHVGEEFNLSTNIEVPVKYTSSNTQYAVVDSNGKVTAVGLPKNANSVNVTITAEYKGKKETCIVTIVGEDLGLNYTDLNIQVNEQVQLSEVNGLNVTWASLNSDIATVSSNGLVTGKKVGVTYITATSVYGDVVTCRVAVTSAEIILSTNSIELDVNETKQVTVANPETDNIVIDSWESENNNIATVDSNGNITGKSEGITRIVATSTNGNVAYVVVRVNTQATVEYDLYFTETVYTVSVNDDVDLKYVKSPASQTVTFSSDNTSVATVNNAGKVVGVSGGKAIITANLVVDGRVVISAKALVYVIEIVEEDEFIIFNSTSVILTRVNESYALTYKTNVTGTITFASSNTNVATVDGNGVITAVGAGTATITASANGKVLAQCTVTIVIEDVNTPAVDNYNYKVDIKNPICNINMEVGRTRYVYATTYGTDQGANITEENIVWESSNPSVATVTDTNTIIDGILALRRERIVVTAVGAGTATIIAKVIGKDGTVKAMDTKTVTVVKNFDNYISSVEELDAMREMRYSCYYLVANIDMTGYDWEPIGDVNHPFNRNFTAKFNGVRYSIKNLNVDASNNSNVMYGGLFGYLGLCSDIRFVTLDNVTVSGYQVAGAIAGFNNGSIRYARVNNVTISSVVAAGGIAGINDSRIFNCTVSGGSLTLNTNNNNCGIGGIAGVNKCIIATVNVLGALNICGNSGTIGATISVNVGGVCGHNSGSVTDAVVNNSAESNIYLEGNTRGNIGGIVGLSQGSITDAYFTGKLTASTTEKIATNVGGIVGYFIGGALDVVYRVGVKAANIVGYAAGGIAGVINSTQKYLLNVSKYGLGEKTLGTYLVNFAECAVDASVNIKGAVAGGIASLINSGVVTNSYSQAKVSGIDSSSILAGLVAEIQSHLNVLGYGTAGLMKQCYSASTFSGAGSKHAVTSSDIHVEGSARGSAGFIMNYLWDSTVSKGASAPEHSWRKNADYIAKATTAALQQIKTYINQGFTNVYWALTNGGYVKLNNINFDNLTRVLND